MSNNTPRVIAALKNLSLAIPIITILSVCVAFLYEAGFAWSLRLPMQSMLDVSDLVRTSIFVVPFMLLIIIVGMIPHFFSVTSNGAIDEQKFRQHAGRMQPLIWGLVILIVLDFLHFALLGSAGGPRFWVFGALILFVTEVIKRAGDILNSDLPHRLLALLVLSTFVIAFPRGVDDAMNSTLYPEGGLARIENEESSKLLVRRFSTHLIVFASDSTLALTGYDGKEVFRWEFEPRSWRGLICDRPPTDKYGTASGNRCSLPQWLY